MNKKSILTLSTAIFLTLACTLNAENNSSTAEPLNEVIIKIPQVPQVPDVPKVEAIVPDVITVNSDGEKISTTPIELIKRKKKKVVFSNHVAPDKFSLTNQKEKEEILVGDIKNGRVAAYLYSALLSVDEVKVNLEKAGFTILDSFKIDKKGKVTSIVFTNKEMQKAASKKMRGFAASLRVTVDSINKVTVISNPIYVMAAFMQKEYDEVLATKTLKQLRDNFTDLKNSEEIVKFKVLERFHFMENMPYYQDMKTIKKAKNKTLLAKAKKSKKVVFEQKLDNGSILIGVQLSKRTTKFVKKIGYKNSGLLPYPVLIENGEAKILEPQYYIAVMYPMLKMSKFMTIATVPGAIGKDIDKIFR